MNKTLSVTRPGGKAGFNGTFHEPATGWQILGNGYRVYNPVLMRFHSPDNLSPFGKGGVNAYTYCAGDPVNRVDPTGHGWLRTAFRTLLRRPHTLSSKANGIPAAFKITKEGSKEFLKVVDNDLISVLRNTRRYYKLEVERALNSSTTDAFSPLYGDMKSELARTDKHLKFAIFNQGRRVVTKSSLKEFTLREEGIVKFATGMRVDVFSSEKIAKIRRSP